MLFGAGTREQMFACPALLLRISHRCFSSVEHMLMWRKRSSICGVLINLFMGCHKFYALRSSSPSERLSQPLGLCSASLVWTARARGGIEITASALHVNAVRATLVWLWYHTVINVELDVKRSAKRMQVCFLATHPPVLRWHLVRAPQRGTYCLLVPRCCCGFPIVAFSSAERIDA